MSPQIVNKDSLNVRCDGIIILAANESLQAGARTQFVVGSPTQTDGEKAMPFPVLVEEFVGPNGRGHGMILMLEDGTFEGLIFRKERAEQQNHACWEHRIEDYEVCAVSEMLPTVKEMINEELGL